MTGMRRLMLGFGLAAAAAGCDQAVRTLEPAIRTVHVAEFRNQTSSGALPAMLEDELRRALRLDARLTVRDDPQGADAVLDGSVATYTREPARFDANNIVQEYRIHLVIEATLTDGSGRRSLWSVRGSSAPPAAGAGPARSLDRYASQVVVPAAGLAVQSEEEVQRQLARELARDLVVKVLEGW